MLSQKISLVPTLLGILFLLASHRLFLADRDTWRRIREARNNVGTVQDFIKTNNQAKSPALSLEEDVCASTLEDPYYQKLINSYLNAWHKFVPHQTEMDSSNCWYVKNFNALPQSLTKRLTNLVNFDYIRSRHSEKEIGLIFSTLFNNNTDKAVVSQQPTNHHYCLPTVNLIGFTKSGSTLLYQLLASHPLLAEPHSKEGQFWRDVMDIKDPEYQELAVLLYTYHFYSASQLIKANPSMFTIDASVSTVFATSRPFRDGEKDTCIVPLMISKTMPKMKFLVLTRNPIDRLWSDFFYFCPPKKWDRSKALKGLEKTPVTAASLFHNYTVTALQEFRTCLQSGHTLFHCTALAGSYPAQEASCKRVRLGVSMYYIHIIKWFQLFPREQILATRLEDLVSDPSSIMDEVWKFIGIPPIQSNITSKVKPSKWVFSGSSSEKFKMFPETRKLLTEFFHPYNVKLARLLNDERFLWAQN